MRTLNIMRIALDVAALDDEKLEALATGIVQTAPQSAIYGQSQPIKDCVAVLATQQTKYKQAIVDVNTTSAKLDTQKQTAAETRSDVLTTVVQLKGLVETTAKTPGDVTAMGYTNLDKATPGVLQPPPGIDIFYPKNGHGRAKVTAQETGTRKRYEAQIATDAAQTAWTDLDGYGKSHWLKGYKAGTVIAVRFRTVRGHDKSEWGSAVTVTIP